MAKTIDHDAELSRAGAGVESRLGKAFFLARRYPLGAVGLLLFMGLLFCGIFAGSAIVLYRMSRPIPEERVFRGVEQPITLNGPYAAGASS